MNKNNRNNNDIIDLIEFNNEMTKFRSDDQYLVTLKMRNSRSARSTDKPNEPPLKYVQRISNNDPNMTIQSNRLNADSKYLRGPSAYILMHISIMKSARNTYSAKTTRDRRKEAIYSVDALRS